MPEESEGSERGQPLSVARPVREVWLETWVVLAVAVVPALFHSFASAYFPGRSSVGPSRYHSFYLILDAAGWSALILYLIWKSGEPWSDFGLCRPRWSVDMLLGLGIWLGWRILFVVLRPGLEALSNLESLTSILPDKDYEILQPRGLVEYLLAGASCSAIGFGEELLFRGYLIPRLERLIGSKWKSIGVTALLFAFWHAYQGVYGVAGTAVWGFTFGIFFCGFRRLWPLAMAHALHNFLSTIRFLG